MRSRREFLALTGLLLTPYGRSLAARPPRECGLDDCFEPPAGDEPPVIDEPPIDPPVDEPPQGPPTSTGPGFVTAFSMNRAGQRPQFYTYGIANCPFGPDFRAEERNQPYWCVDGLADGQIRFNAGFNLIQALNNPSPDFNDFRFAIVKSRNGLSEYFRSTPEALRIETEEMNWDDNKVYRDFFDDRWNLGAIWVRNGRPSGEFLIDYGGLKYYECPNTQTPTETHFGPMVNALHGPYEISTADGLSRARDELSFLACPGNERAIPDAWNTFPEQLGMRGKSMTIWAVCGRWGLRSGQYISTRADAWHFEERYLYGTVDYGGANQGVGLLMWQASNWTPARGDYVPARQHIHTTVGWMPNYLMPLALCENPNLRSASAQSSSSLIVSPHEQYARGREYPIPRPEP